MSNNNKENQLDYIKTIFSHNFSLIQLADTKANILLGINSILIPVIFGVMGLNFYTLLGGGYLIQAISLNSFSLISLLSLAFSFIFSIMVIKARYIGDLSNNLFFKNIIDQKFDEYREIILKSDENYIKDDFIKEIYSIAQINKKKYKNYDYSLWFMLLGIGFLIFGYVFITIINFSIIS